MSSTTLFRLSGLALFLGGLLGGFPFLHPQRTDPGYFTHPLTVPVHLAGFVAVLLILLGLPGLYARQAARAGLLGLVGIVLVFFSLALLDGTHNIVDGALLPALAHHPSVGPLLVPGGPVDTAVQEGPLGTLVDIGGPLFILGCILLGSAIVRARVLPRWTGVLIAVAWVLIPISFAVPRLEDIAFGLPYLALACAGFVLMIDVGVAHHDAPTSVVAPR
jgi:hypothetical protein